MSVFDKLSELEIYSYEKQALLEKLMRLFLEYNEKVNLISRHDTELFFEKHIYDSLAFSLFKQKYLEKTPCIKLLDIGSGGGLPALPIAAAYSNIDVTAVDSIQKKINFINYAAVSLSIKNIRAVCKRAEELPFKAEFDAVSSRAMAQMRVMLEYSIPYLKKGGFLVLYKSLKAEEEIKNAQNALKLLKSEVIDKIEYNLPAAGQYMRSLIIVRKNDDTPGIYPRKNGLISKKPL